MGCRGGFGCARPGSRGRDDSGACLACSDGRPAIIAEALRWSTPLSGSGGRPPRRGTEALVATRRGRAPGCAHRSRRCTYTYVRRGWGIRRPRELHAGTRGGRAGSGFWFEADPERARACSPNSKHGSTCERIAPWSARTTSSRLMENAGVPNVPDVLSLDIDGNDFWVLRLVAPQAMRRAFVVVEYNATFPPGHFWTRRERERAEWDDTYRHGASLDALAWALRPRRLPTRGMRVGGSERVLRARRRRRRRRSRRRTPLIAAVPAPGDRLTPRIGHPWWAEPDCPRLTDVEMARVRIVGADIVARRPDADSRGTSVGIRARIDNANASTCSRRLGPTPLYLSAHCDRGGRCGGEPRHGTQLLVRRRAAAQPALGRVPCSAPTCAPATLRVCLVHEGISWLLPGAFDVRLN